MGQRRGDQQVEVSWTEEALVQVAELNHYLFMDAQRPTFMTEHQTAVLHLRRTDRRRWRRKKRRTDGEEFREVVLKPIKSTLLTICAFIKFKHS